MTFRAAKKESIVLTSKLIPLQFRLGLVRSMQARLPRQVLPMGRAYRE